ncbi:dipeptide ABC transporter ATP-binding protein [Nakamurella sp. YIM 132087]|uniref:Dipeptide ABC transporter ATP-binding protein n=1 Tax=Nakamurella alba TaxID=2665158 RepID=A0A7K1FEW3_9ACTN|nr:ABC transporter ATP-binding protein [Nakamurella alba]MTD12647.1 dipeptide ABC transporter ATP-binding protein [Nakamurella alba]
MTGNLLQVRDLTVRYTPRLGRALTAVDHVSFDLAEGEFVGLIGESGCGKSTLGTALLRLLEPPAHLTDGEILFEGEDLLALSPEELRTRRWSEISTVFQSSMNSLNPVIRIGASFRNVIEAHTDLDRSAADDRAAELLDMVSIDRKFLDSYPHELSGGMRQRINLALALALKPKFVLLDEPTTGLDVVVQRSILDNVRRLQAEQGFTVLFISHDMGTVLETSDRIMVMYAGRLVEVATSRQLLTEPLHPYSKALLASYGDPRAETVSISYLPGRPPDLSRPRQGCSFAARCPEVIEACRTIDPPLEEVAGEEVACIVAAAQHGKSEPGVDEVPEKVDEFVGPSFTKSIREPGDAEAAPIIEVRDVTRQYKRRRGFHTTVTDAVQGVSFTLRDGMVTALVGESGSGKSTLARMITGVEKPTSGQVLFHSASGEPAEPTSLSRSKLKEFRRTVQYVFQDPYAALNPAHTIGYSLAVPVRNYDGLRGKKLRDRVLELLDTVGLTPAASFAGRYPYQLSGGQRQRVVIARALAPQPRLLVADEPVASLDVSIRAEILELLHDLVQDHGVGILYITHDLLSARMLADEALVLSKGKVVESGNARTVITEPKDPYTRKLLAAIPNPAAARDQVA